jgi:hypothetical protein
VRNGERVDALRALQVEVVPQSFRALGVQVRERPLRKRGSLEDHVAMQVLHARRGGPLECDERRELAGMVVALCALDDSLPLARDHRVRIESGGPLGIDAAEDGSFDLGVFARHQIVPLRVGERAVRFRGHVQRTQKFGVIRYCQEVEWGMALHRPTHVLHWLALRVTKRVVG